MDVTFRDGEESSITVDSGAEESVCPVDWGAHFGTNQVSKPMEFKDASGGIIKHYGERRVEVTSPF